LQQLFEGPEVLCQESLLGVNVELVLLSLANLKSCHEVTDKHITFLCKLYEVVDVFQQQQEACHAKQHVGVDQPCQNAFGFNSTPFLPTQAT